MGLWPCPLLPPGAICARGAAAAPTTRAPPPAGLSGYMDLHYNKLEFEDGILDFHRFVLLVTYRFTDRIRFTGELELEHAFVEGLEEAGELELEQAYLDFLLTRSFNVRAGMLLMPMGIINERHEPPVYYGVERPFVDTFIIPTTWFEVGAGVHGEVGHGWRYRAYVTAPLNAAEFSADEGIREGRQKGAESNIGRAAVTGRVEYVGLRGLTAGASAWTGRSGFEFRPRFDVPVTVWEADARYSRDRLELRAQFARVSIDNAGELKRRWRLRPASTPTSPACCRAHTSKPVTASSPARASETSARSYATRTSTRSTGCPPDTCRSSSSIGTRGSWAPRTGPTRTSRSRPTTWSCATGARDRVAQPVQPRSRMVVLMPRLDCRRLLPLLAIVTASGVRGRLRRHGQRGRAAGDRDHCRAVQLQPVRGPRQDRDVDRVPPAQ